MNSLALNALLQMNGGKGSGNFGHAGRPGQIGGSGSGKGGSGSKGSGDLEAKKKELKAAERKLEKARTSGGASEYIAAAGKVKKLKEEIKAAEGKKGSEKSTKGGSARKTVKEVIKKGGSYENEPDKDAYSLADQLSSGKEYGLGKAFKETDAGKAYDKIQSEVGGDHGADGYAKIASESFGGNSGKETSKQLEAKREKAHKDIEEYAKSADSNEKEHEKVKEFFDGLIDEYYDNYGANKK